MPRILTTSLTQLLGKQRLYLVLGVSAAYLAYLLMQANAESGGGLISALFLGR